MQLKYELTHETEDTLWVDATKGEVYQSTNQPNLLAIAGERQQAFCIRAGEGVDLHSIWTPGPKSKWRHVPSTLILPPNVG